MLAVVDIRWSENVYLVNDGRESQPRKKSPLRMFGLIGFLFNECILFCFFLPSLFFRIMKLTQFIINCLRICCFFSFAADDDAFNVVPTELTQALGKQVTNIQ